MDGYSDYNHSLLPKKIKRKYHLHAYMVIFPSSGCRLGYVVPLLHFKATFYPPPHMIQDSIEEFMDDLSFVGDTFEECFKHLRQSLQRCVETNLVYNWEKWA